MTTSEAHALARFFTEIDASSRAADVFVMITSEFGRQITQNGGLGVDHGRGSATILVGGGVKGGNYGQLPSLAPAARDSDSMVPTVDFRSVWSTVLNRLGGEPNLTEAIMGRDESRNSFGDVGVFTTGPSMPLPPPSGGGTTTTQPGNPTTTQMGTTMPASSMPTSMPTSMPMPTTMMPTTTKATTTTVKPTTTTAKPTTTMKATTTTVRRTTTTVKRTTTTVKKRTRAAKAKPKTGGRK